MQLLFHAVTRLPYQVEQFEGRIDFMSIQKKFYNIIDGPSNHQLVDALKYANDNENPMLAIFTAELVDGEDFMNTGVMTPGKTSFKLKMKINCLQHEDSSGRSFNVRGLLISPGGDSYWVTGYYHAGNHTGCFATE